MRHVFLDHQSTTPVRPEVFAAMMPYFSEAFGSPSSLHQAGPRARDALAKARAQVARLINAGSADDILFTSDGTEAANQAVKGVACANRRRGNHLVVSAIEHPSILNSVAFLEAQGFTCTRVKVDREGLVDPEAVRAAITRKTILIAVQHVNPDLGTIQSVRAIGKIAAAGKIPFYVDADASAGWLPIDVSAFGADLLSFSPHKFYGPKGVGILYRNRQVRLASLLHGGAQENGLRAGLENVPAIVGAGVAAEIALRELPSRSAHTAKLQSRLWSRLRATIPRLTLNGPEPGPRRISTTLHLSVALTEGDGLVLLCDLNGIAVASGSGCAGKSVEVAHVLRAIGLDPVLAQGSLILSLGQDNTTEEIDYVCDTFGRIVSKLRGLSPAGHELTQPASSPKQRSQSKRKSAANPSNRAAN